MTKDEALKMAIKLLESLKTGKENFAESNIHVVCSMCEEALAQPAQEPVAWMNDIAFSMDKELLGTRSRIVPLYTHPAPAHPASWRRLSKKKLGKIYGNDEIDWYAYEAIDEALQKLNPFL